MVETAQKQSFKDTLRGWCRLERRKCALEKLLPRQEELYIELNLKLTASGIKSTITQQYTGMLLGLPRGSDVSDKTGDLVAITLERQDDATEQLIQLRREYLDVTNKIARIELEISVVSDRHRQVLEMFYRDKIDWQGICLAMCIEKTRMYKMRDEAIDDINRGVWQT